MLHYSQFWWKVINHNANLVFLTPDIMLISMIFKFFSLSPDWQQLQCSISHISSIFYFTFALIASFISLSSSQIICRINQNALPFISETIIICIISFWSPPCHRLFLCSLHPSLLCKLRFTCFLTLPSSDERSLTWKKLTLFLPSQIIYFSTCCFSNTLTTFA